MKTLQDYREQITRIKGELDTRTIESKMRLLYLLIRKRYSATLVDRMKEMYNVLESIFPNRVGIGYSIHVGERTVTQRTKYFPVDTDASILDLFYTDEEYAHTRDKKSKFLYLEYRDTIQIVEGLIITPTDTTFVIHFPEIEITNTAGLAHIIKDLFVRFKTKIQVDGDDYIIYISDIKGMRTTYSNKELKCGYVHSHLCTLAIVPGMHRPSDADLTKWENFCLGSGDISSIRAIFNDEQDIDKFEAFCWMIDSFVRWESTEGTPYISMSKLVNMDHTMESMTDLTMVDLHNELLRRVRNSYDVSFSWGFWEGKYYIEDDEDFQAWLVNIFPFEAKYCKDATGTYFIKRDFPRIAEDSLEHLSFTFKGKKIPYKVYNEMSEDFECTRYINPKLSNYVKYRLEKIANYAIIKKGTVRRQDTGNTVEENTREDSIFVPVTT